ncbi:MAG: hypothetical protein WAN36_09895 [Calditrichia bacterium]
MKNINKTLLVTCLCLLCMLPAVKSAELSDIVPDAAPGEKAPKDPLFHETVMQGIQFTFSDQYEKSLALFDSLIQHHPDHPAPYFFKAAAYQNLMSAFRVNNFQEEVEKNIEMAINKGQDRLDAGSAQKNDDQKAWMYFYMGAAYGYRGFNKFRKHNWLGAYGDGKKGIDYFKKALKTEPTLYDVYLGLGSYHYWRTAKSSFIRIIAFWMPDKRELGLKQLQFSIDHGRYSPNEAGYVLVIACMDYHREQQALEVLKNLMAKKDKPNVTDLYLRGRLAAYFEKWEDSESYFISLLQKLQEQKYQSAGYFAEVKYRIANAMYHQGNTGGALKLNEDALALAAERNPDQELEGPLEGFDEIKEQMESLHQILLNEK